MRTDILNREQEIREWIQQAKSKAFMCEQLHCKPLTLDTYLAKMGISYKGNRPGKGQPKKRQSMDIHEYLSKSKGIQTSKIHIKLLESGIKKHQCERCMNTEWMGAPIPLEVHHKDGDISNNSIENFEMLCPNCHAFTDSYRGKNCKK
jgi:hypothetical protein